jgi:hypothetical protein
MSVANDKWDSDTVPLWRTGPRRRAFMVRDAVQTRFTVIFYPFTATSGLGTPLVR